MFQGKKREKRRGIPDSLFGKDWQRITGEGGVRSQMSNGRQKPSVKKLLRLGLKETVVQRGGGWRTGFGLSRKGCSKETPAFWGTTRSLYPSIAE